MNVLDTAGRIKVAVQALISDAQYLVLAAHANLSQERVFTPATPLSGADGGAGAAYTLSLPISSLTENTAPAATDWLLVENNAGGTFRKVQRLNVAQWILISTNTLGGSAASVTFSSIPATYKMLAFSFSARTDAALEADNLLLRFNADTGANYDRQVLRAVGTTVSALVARAATALYVGDAEGNSSRASTFNSGIVYVANYASTDQEKRVTGHNASTIGNVSADADLSIHLISGHWRNTAAITSLTLLPGTGPNLVTGSKFHLWGIG